MVLPTNASHSIQSTECSTIVEAHVSSHNIPESDANENHVRDKSSNHVNFYIQTNDEPRDDCVSKPCTKAQQNGFNNGRLSKYEVHYESLLKRSIQIWKEIQKDKSENKTVDDKKLTTLDLFL